MSHLEIIRQRRGTLRERFAEQMRSIWLGPWNTKDKELARMFGGSPGSSGIAVNETTALNYSAVWSAVNLISADVADVPLKLFRRDRNGGKTPFDDHPLYRLIHAQPNPQMGSAVFRRTLQAHKLVWGNGYAEIERDVVGRPIALWPLLPYTVQPYIERGLLRYRVFNPNGNPIEFASSDMIHLRGFSEDGICGVSTVAKARESFGLSIAAERMGSTFFGNGSTFGGIISYPAGLGTNPQVRKENRDEIEKRHQGVDRAHRFLTLYEGAVYTQLGVPPNDAQFLETREFQIEEVCRWFNVQPHKLKHLKRSTNNNIEQQSIEYQTDTLEPHYVDWEQELNMKLVAPLERSIQVIEHVREGRLRGDSVSRSELQSKQFSIAMLTPNEGRAQENRNPVEGGDRPFVAMNLIPLDRVDEWFDAQIKSKTAPPPAPANTSPNTAAATGEIKALQDALELSRHATQLAEGARDKVMADAASAQQVHEQELIVARALQAESEQKLQTEFEMRKAAKAESTSLKAERDTITAERDEKIRQLAASEEARAAADRALAVEAEQLVLERTARLQAEAERDEARTLATQIEQDRDAATERATAAEAERDAVKAADIEWRGRVEADLETAKQFTWTVEQDRDAARTITSVAEEARDAALTKVAELEAQRDAALIQAGQAETAKAAALLRAEQLDQTAATALADIETLKTDLARARADIATELERARTQKDVMLAAMRSLFVDAAERLLQKESDRARKHQATPEKLRSWLTQFYPLHTEVCRAAFQPLVGPWTAMAGGAPGELLERLVSEHIETSETALRIVAEVDDPDELAANLERTLSRWEHERAETMADALVREGMNYG